jgi:hypothetical protein
MILVAYGKYSSLVHRDLYLGYIAGASIITLGLFVRIVGTIIFPLGIALASVGIVHALLLYWARWDIVRFGLPTNTDFAMWEFYGVLIGVILAVLGHFFRRTEYEEYVASSRTVQYRPAPRTYYIETATPVRRAAGDTCASCGKEMGMFTHALKCPACGRYWCADCCGRNSDDELVCPVDRVDNMGRRG